MDGEKPGNTIFFGVVSIVCLMALNDIEMASNVRGVHICAYEHAYIHMLIHAHLATSNSWALNFEIKFFSRKKIKNSC